MDTPATCADPTRSSDGLCEAPQFAALNKVASYVDPSFRVTLTNNFTGGGAGQLYMDNIRARVLATEKPVAEATEMFCTSQGGGGQSSVGIDVDKSPSAYSADSEGNPDKSVGPPYISLTPGETVTFPLYLRGTGQTYHVTVLGTLHNGNGAQWTVDLTAQHGPFLLPGTAGVLFTMTIEGAVPPDYFCESLIPPGAKGTCALAIAPTRAELESMLAAPTG